jgi:GH43 family beta-xylosidase
MKKAVLGVLMASMLVTGAVNAPLSVHAADPTSDGHGLIGEFYKVEKNPDDRNDISVFNFVDFRGERAVANLNGDSFTSIFNQLSGTPDFNTARFTGTIVPTYTEDYTFHMIGDDGFRLWINGEKIIDFWQQAWEIPQDSVAISLEAGKHYDIKIEYLQGWGGSWLRMEWESASQQRQVVPESALFLPSDHILPTKKDDLTAEIQKIDYLTGNFAGEVSQNELNAIQTAKGSAEATLNTIDAQALTDGEKVELLTQTIQSVSVARANFMKQMGVTSSTVFNKFNNPLYQGQDPFVTYHDGYYYFVSSSNLDSNNKVYVSKSRTLTDQGEKVLVYDSQGTQTRIFAPEIFFLNGRWYIYYCADRQDYGYKHMATVLESTTSDAQSPFIDKGALYAGENGVYKQANDFTVFEKAGQLYAVWGTLGDGEPAGSAIAPMDNPYTISEDRTIIPGGGEGPRVLQKDGQVFITVSEGDYASNGYRLSYFRNTDGDVLNPGSWTRANDVFVATSDVSGPARASFVKSVDGTEDWMMYHSRVYKDTGRNWWREVNIKKFDWNPDGTPNFGQPVSPNEWQNLPSGDLGQGDMYQAEDAVLYGGMTSEHVHTNYQGTGYVHLPTTSGAEASFVVQAPLAGDYIVGTRYAYGVQVDGESTNNPTTQLPGRAKVNVYVNGEYVKSIAPDKTAVNWDEWFTDSERLSLQQGKNVISYRIDNSSIGNVNLDYLTMYKADVPNEYVSNQLAGKLTGTTAIQAGQSFVTTYGLTHVSNKAEDAVYAQDLIVNYDASKLDLESAVSKKEGLSVIGFKKIAPGQAHILLASLGAANTVSTDGDLLTLHWKALTVANDTSITITPAEVANAKGVETLLAPIAWHVNVTSGEISSPDINADGRVSVGDLGILAFSYGLTTSSLDWEQVQKMDFNHDGVIDIVDLAALARAIIE